MQRKFQESSLRRFFFIGNCYGQRSCDSSDILRLQEYATALPLAPMLSKAQENHKYPPSGPPFCHS